MTLLERINRRWAARVIVTGIRLYQVSLAWLFRGACRFWPSCSEYAVEAVGKHGAWRGARLASARLLRCHPFNPGGVDPVP